MLITTQAVASTCPPHLVPSHGTGSYIKYIINSTQTHTAQTFSIRKCDKCNERVDVFVGYTLSDCRGNIYTNIGHSGNTHTYRVRCVCGRTYPNLVVPCNGPPCFTPTSTPLLLT